MKLARWTFIIAGLYGVIVIAPLYLLENTIDRQNPPAITHPMFYYGFIGVALVWQLLFFAIARQPLRLRPVIPFAILEKLSFGIGAMVLYHQRRLDPNDRWFGAIDLCWALLFLIVWVRLKQAREPDLKSAA